MKTGIINPSDCPYHLITRTTLAMTSLLKRNLAQLGYPDVKPAYLGVLRCLWMEDSIGDALSKLGKVEGMKLVDLAKCAGLEQSSMTGLIDRMEKDGLVCRNNDPGDRRVNIIRLTERGATVREGVVRIVNEMIDEVFAGIPKNRTDMLKDLLRTVLLNANKGALSERK